MEFSAAIRFAKDLHTEHMEFEALVTDDPTIDPLLFHLRPEIVKKPESEIVKKTELIVDKARVTITETLSSLESDILVQSEIDNAKRIVSEADPRRIKKITTMLHKLFGDEVVENPEKSKKLIGKKN